MFTCFNKLKIFKKQRNLQNNMLTDISRENCQCKYSNSARSESQNTTRNTGQIKDSVEHG